MRQHVLDIPVALRSTRKQRLSTLSAFSQCTRPFEAAARTPPTVSMWSMPMTSARCAGFIVPSSRLGMPKEEEAEAEAEAEQAEEGEEEVLRRSIHSSPE